MVLVPRREVEQISLRHGLLSPHPIFQAILGLCLTAVGYFPTLHLIHWFLHGGEFLQLELALIVVAFYGISTFVSVLNRGYFRDVRSTAGRKRLAFQGQPNLLELHRFVEQVEVELGVKIDRLTAVI